MVSSDSDAGPIVHTSFVLLGASATNISLPHFYCSAAEHCATNVPEQQHDRIEGNNLIMKVKRGKAFVTPEGKLSAVTFIYNIVAIYDELRHN